MSGLNCRPRRQPATPSSAFTLIELLVVLGIIGVLAALMMPALTRAKRQAQNIVCVNQLRQLGTAVRMYGEDNQQRLPSIELLPSLPVDPASPLPRLCDVLRAYAGSPASATNTAATVFKCPSDFTRRFAKEGASYEWNVSLNGHRIDETRTSNLKVVKVVVVNGEEVMHTEDQKELLFPPAITPLLLDYEEYHPRPPKSGKNVAYMDGHVTGLELPPLPAM